MLGILWVNDMFGYTELALLRSRLLVLTSSLVPDVFRRQAATSRHTRIGRHDSRVCRHMWIELRQFADRHHLSKVRLDLEPAYGGGDAVMWERHQDDDGSDNWQTRIPLATQGQGVAYIEFTGSLDGEQGAGIARPVGRPDRVTRTALAAVGGSAAHGSGRCDGRRRRYVPPGPFSPPA